MSCRVSFARFPLFAAVLCMVLTTAHAASVTWTNAPGTASWTNGANWSGGVAPAAVDSVFLTNLANSYTVNFDTASSVVITNLTLRGGGANAATLNINSGMLMITGALASSFGSNSVVNINPGGVFFLNGPNAVWNGTTMNVSGGAWTNIMGRLMLQPNVAGRTSTVSVTSGTFSETGQFWLDAQGGVAQLLVSGGYTDITTPQFANTSRNLENYLKVSGGVLRSGSLDLRSGQMLVSGGVVTNAGALSMGGNNAGSTGIVVQTDGVWEQVGDVNMGGASNSLALITLGGGTFSGRGALAVGRGSFTSGILSVTNGSWFQQGLVTVAGSDAARTGLVGNITVSGGSFVATNSLLVANAFNGSATGSVTVLGGTLAVTNAARTAWLEIGRLGQGTLNLSNGTLLVDRLLVTNGASSVVNFAGGTLQSRSTTVSNGTLFTVGDGLSVASLSLNGGSHRFANNLMVSSNASLAGTGTVVAASLTSHGTIAPGFSPGTLTVTGDVSLASDSILSMELAGTNAGAFDVLNVVGNLDLGGLLKVSLLSYAPQAGDSFDLLNGALSGAFLAYNLPVLGGGLSWDTSLLGVDGTLLVTAVPEPGAGALLGIALLAGAAWRSRRGKR